MRQILSFVIIVLSTNLLPAQTPTEPGKGSISGLMFGDYSYNVAGKSPDMQKFEFRRIYFTYDYDLNPTFTMRFRLEADQGAFFANGKLSSFIKDAYLKWKGIYVNADFTFGIQPTPAFEFSEAAWGYRCIEKTILDLNGIQGSRDFGVSLRGKADEGGMLNYFLLIGNNSGNNQETDKYKRFSGLVQAKPIKGMQVYAVADFAPALPVTVFGDSKKKDVFTLAAFAGYEEKDKYSAGIEWFTQSKANFKTDSTAKTTPDLKRTGLSVFGWYAFSDVLRGAVRFDKYDPDSGVDKDGWNTAYLGVDYLLAKDIHVIPNVILTMYENTDSKSDVTGRVTFFFQFK